MRACLWPAPRPPEGEPHPPMPRPAPPPHVACSSPCLGSGVVVRQVPTRPVIRSRSQKATRSEEHTSELQSRLHLVCRLLLEKKKPRNHEPHLYRFLIMVSHPHFPGGRLHIPYGSICSARGSLHGPAAALCRQVNHLCRALTL